MIQLEMDIPAPEEPRGRPAAYPFNSMEVGHSFWARKTKSQVQSAMYSWRKRNGKLGRQFIVREEAGGSRCWRTK